VPLLRFWASSLVVVEPLDLPAVWRFNLLMRSQPAKRKPSAKKKTSSPVDAPKLPVASRPVMPAQYGISKSAKGMLDWKWARERLTGSHNYVIVTVRPDGRPHAMGMHGLWFEDAFYFGTADSTRKAKNLAANPNCILINEQLDELVIVEGTAEKIGYKTVAAALSDVSKKKYGWPIQPSKSGSVFRVVPKTVFALPEKEFATAPTRWKFEE
jgi:nitroimidazol reductase NimA-like FMN-containing flavoprotein (pyridoxamine 5'-phosphate oxidase superfamily)